MARYLFLSLNVLNGLLALAVAAVLHFAVIPLLNPSAGISLPAVRETPASLGERRAAPRLLPAASYAALSDRNLFHPERKIPPEKQPDQVVPKPDVYLYGTLITEEGSIAFIEDKKSPHTTPGRGKRQTVLKQGDVLNGYTLGEITANRIIFLKGDDRVVVMLEDGQKKRSEPATAAAGPRGAAAGGPPAAPLAVFPGAVATTPGAAAPSSPQGRAAPQPTPSAASPATSLFPLETPSRAGTEAPLPRQPSPPPVRTSPPAAPSVVPDAPSRPGIGASGSWPPTQESVGQTQQRIQEGRKMRSEQIKQAQ